MPVPYDPFDAGPAYAFIRKRWVRCISEHHARFAGRNARSSLASPESHRRKQRHNHQFRVTAQRLADFLASVDREEVVLERRLPDAEARTTLKPLVGTPLMHLDIRNRGAFTPWRGAVSAIEMALGCGPGWTAPAGLKTNVPDGPRLDTRCTFRVFFTCIGLWSQQSRYRCFRVQKQLTRDLNRQPTRSARLEPVGGTSEPSRIYGRLLAPCLLSMQQAGAIYRGRDLCLIFWHSAQSRAPAPDQCQCPCPGARESAGADTTAT